MYMQLVCFIMLLDRISLTVLSYCFISFLHVYVYSVFSDITGLCILFHATPCMSYLIAVERITLSCACHQDSLLSIETHPTLCMS